MKTVLPETQDVSGVLIGIPSSAESLGSQGKKEEDE